MYNWRGGITFNSKNKKTKKIGILTLKKEEKEKRRGVCGNFLFLTENGAFYCIKRFWKNNLLKK